MVQESTKNHILNSQKNKESQNDNHQQQIRDNANQHCNNYISNQAKVQLKSESPVSIYAIFTYDSRSTKMSSNGRHI